MRTLKFTTLVNLGAVALLLAAFVALLISPKTYQAPSRQPASIAR